MGLLMKLKNGDTSFKSLKFGNDRPGGGDSGQPYVQTSIEGQAENTAIDGDGIIRGGLTAPSRALEDSTRLTKYLFSFKNPSGLLFTAKQNLLSRIAAKTETAYGPAYGGFSQSLTQGTTDVSFTKGNGFFNEGIYTPLSTIMQAQVGYLGQHLNKQGLDPTGAFENAAIRKYGDVAYENNKLENNAHLPKVPVAIIRKEDRLSRKETRKILQTNRQKQRVEDEFERLPTRIEDPIKKRSNPEALSGVNGFLARWDAYRDKRAIERLGRKERSEAFTSEQLQLTRENREAIENGEVVYDNRLLNLWDSKGLTLVDPRQGRDPILYSYGGGPNSSLGFGTTNIKFATLNDGVTPARTGANRKDPYGPIYVNEEPIFKYGKPLDRPNNPIYSTTHIFNQSVSIKYANEYDISPLSLFGNDTNDGNYLIDKDNTEDIQPWANNKYIRSNTKFVTDPNTFKTVSTTWNYNDYISQELNETGELKESFTTILTGSNSRTFIAKSPDYLNDNFQKRFNIGKTNDPGQRGDRSDYVRGKKDLRNGKVLGAVDTLNTIPVYKSKKGDISLTKNYKEVEDFCEFKFAVLDTRQHTSNKFYLHFRAYLEGFSDSYKAKYNNINYLGRGENFYKYGGYDRDISFDFQVVALSKQELLPIYRKLNFLASTLAPTYTTAGYMGGTLTEVTIGSYLYNQPGIITSMNIKVPDDTTWETQMSNGQKLTTEGGDKNVISDFRDPTTQVMPHRIIVSISFTPVHNFRVQSQGGTTSDIMELEELLKNMSDKSNNIDKNKYGIEKYINLVNKISDGYENNEIPKDNGNIKAQTNVQKNEITQYEVDPSLVEERTTVDSPELPPGGGVLLYQSNDPIANLSSLGSVQQGGGFTPGSGVLL